MKVRTIDQKTYEVANIIVGDKYGLPNYIIKDWKWNWKRDELTFLPLDSVEEILDDSGSNFRDGYELGLLHGMEREKERLINEGILEPDEDDEEESTVLDPRYDIYE